MKKILLTLALAGLAAGSLAAQNFKPSGSSAEDVFSFQNETVITATGDFNKDGIKDLVIAAPYVFVGENFAFYFGQKGGGYKLFRDYVVRIPLDTDISVTDKGVVRIQCNRGDGNMDVFLFRYENGDFRLIGGKEDRHKTDHYDISYNYLTEKMIRTDGEGKSRKSETRGLVQPPPPIRFGWIPLDYDMLGYITSGSIDNEAPEHMTVMGIFRVMQANEMLFWSFCNHEVEYHDPQFGDGGWTCSDEYMSYGCYNFWSSLDITPQGDGSYFIELFTETEDRTYETLLNEDQSNLEEVLEQVGIEEHSYRTTWLFKDGKFLNETETEIFRDQD